MKHFFLFFFLLFLLLLTPLVTAIGISPPKMRIDYEEGKVVPLDIVIINSGKSDYVQLFTQGPLKEYVSLSEQEFFFKGERLHQFNASFRMPDYDEITEYGPQRFYIGAKDVADPFTLGGGSVTASAAIKMWVEVDIPFPGKYARIETLTADNINEGEDLPVYLKIRNRGTNDLSNSKVTLSLFNFDGKLIDEKTFNNVYIRVENNKTFDYAFPTKELDSGIYTVKAEFFYDDGRSIDREITVFIGSTDVLLTEYSSFLTQGEINKINLTLQSIWGSPLENIRLSLSYDGESTNLPLLDLGPFEMKLVEGFIEPPISEATTLNATLKMEIPVDDGELFEKSIPLQFDLLPPPEKENPLSLSATTFLIGLAIILVLALIVNIFVLTKKHDNSKEDSSSSSKKKK